MNINLVMLTLRCTFPEAFDEPRSLININEPQASAHSSTVELSTFLLGEEGQAT